MRIRATLNGLSLRLDGGETPDVLRKALAEAPELPLEVEVSGQIGVEVLEVLCAVGRGRRLTLRPPRGERFIPYTEVVGQTLRAGQRVESPGTVVVLGDVNPGAEIIAGGDVIVVGKLRGLAHAGAGGNEEASIWASAFEAKQIRIAHHVAQAPDGPQAARSPERARVAGGRIVLEPWGSARPRTLGGERRRDGRP